VHFPVGQRTAVSPTFALSQSYSQGSSMGAQRGGGGGGGGGGGVKAWARRKRARTCEGSRRVTSRNSHAASASPAALPACCSHCPRRTCRHGSLLSALPGGRAALQRARHPPAPRPAGTTHLCHALETPPSKREIEGVTGDALEAVCFSRHVARRQPRRRGRGSPPAWLGRLEQGQSPCASPRPRRRARRARGARPRVRSAPRCSAAAR
jgi:hypothetical protein